MKRQPLEAGTTIQLNSIDYIVDTVIGDGATCIVYKAHYMDSRGLPHTVNIKECYPYADNVSRHGNALQWESEEQRQNSISAFVTTYDKLMNHQLGNFTVHAFDIDEANGTEYIIMDANDGVTFDKDSSTSLTEIFTTVKLLAHVAGQYHDNGYLHLDIKPSNFLVYPRPSEHIILFDMDSITSIEDIKSGKISCVPYSKGWAAPEQIQGQINKLCPATDIYSIGAILFEKIMSRNVEPADTGLFADWDFDEQIFENVNPKIKRLLRNIFKKTLAANVKRRYQLIDTLLKDLDLAIETVSAGMPYIISDYPSPNANFIGRQEELYKIESAFKNNIKTVFLHGFGGIGKSELAKKYAQIHKMDYDAILFLSYENSLEELVKDIFIQNYDENSGDNHNKVLKRVLSKQKVLLIIDNFDIEIDEDAYLDRFLRLNADIIITTRTDFSVLTIDKTTQIDIQSLNKNELIDLFAKECDRSLNNSEKIIVDEILEKYDYYTLLVPIFARQLTSSGWTLEKLKEITDKGLKAFENTEKVKIIKDGHAHKLTGLDMMRATFRVFGLSEIQKQVLINLYFLRFVKVNKEQYRKYFWELSEKRVEHINAINDLLELGWIQKNPGEFSEDEDLTIHPIIVEMILCELNPDITKSDMLMSYMNHYLPWADLKEELLEGVDDWGNLHIDEIGHKLKWFCLFARSIDLNNINNLSYVIVTLQKLLNGNIFVIQLIDYWVIKDLLEKCSDFIGSKALTCEIKFMLLNIFEIYWVGKLTTRIGLSDKAQEKIRANIHKYFNMAYMEAEQLPSPKKDKAITLLCKPIVQLLTQYGYTPIQRSIFEIVCENEDTWLHVLGEDDYFDWEPGRVTFIGDEITTEKCEIQVDTSVVLNKEVDGDLYYSKKYNLGYDVDEIVQELLADTRFSNYEKSCVFSDMTDCVMRNLERYHHLADYEECKKHSDFLESIDWQRFIKLCNHFLEFAQTYEYDCESAEYDIDCANAYIVVAEAMLGNCDNLLTILDCATADMIEGINDIEPDDARDWKTFTQFNVLDHIYSTDYKNTMQLYALTHYSVVLRNLRKNELILPSLIKCANALEKKINENKDDLMWLIHSRDSDKDFTLMYDANSSGDVMSLMYNWYRTIAETALNAYLDVGLSNKKGAKYFEIYTDYLKKLKSLMDKTYAFINYSSRSNKEINFTHYYCQHETIGSICIEYYAQLFQDGIDVNNFNSIIQNDERLSPSNVIEIYSKIAYEAFFEIDRRWVGTGGLSRVRKYLEGYDWNRLEELLTAQENYSLENANFVASIHPYKRGEIISNERRCDMYRALVYAILDDSESFKVYMQHLMDGFKKDFDKSKNKLHWSFFTEFDDIRRIDSMHTFMGKALDYLYDIEKSAWAMPYLLECTEYVHNHLKTLDNYSETMMYNWYKIIVRFTIEAFLEEHDYKWDDMAEKYQAKLDEMSNKDYEETL